VLTWQDERPLPHAQVGSALRQQPQDGTLHGPCHPQRAAGSPCLQPQSPPPCAPSKGTGWVLPAWPHWSRANHWGNRGTASPCHCTVGTGGHFSLRLPSLPGVPSPGRWCPCTGHQWHELHWQDLPRTDWERPKHPVEHPAWAAR